MPERSSAIAGKTRQLQTSALVNKPLHSTQGVMEMFVEHMTAILAGCALAGMGWLMLQWRPAARLDTDD